MALKSRCLQVPSPTAPALSSSSTCTSYISHRRPHQCSRRNGGLSKVSTALLARTRLHGLRYIVSPPGGSAGRRIFWLVALCTSVGFLLSWSSNRLLHWLSFPTYTRVHSEWAKELPFPTVTICNNNPVRLLKLTKSDLYFAGHWLGLLLANRTVRPLVLDLLHEERHAWFHKLTDFRLFLPPRHFEGTTLEFMGRLSHQLEDMMLSCKYRGEACGTHNFTTVFTRYGKCYMFNAAEEGKTLRTTMKGGTGNGLEIMLDIQQDEYLPVWGETEETAFEAGIRVQIHSQAEPPFVHELGFGVAPGFQTFVATQEQRLTYLPPPWGECVSTALTSGFFPVYSVTACRIDCETRYVVENCNCRMVHMPGDAPYCTPEQYKDCAEPALAALSAVEGSGCVCRTPCNTTRYNKELSMVKIPSKTSFLLYPFVHIQYYKSVDRCCSHIFIKGTSVAPCWYGISYEPASLLLLSTGDIGGQMGLFIGASILTILEMFDYAYEMVKERLLDYLHRDEEDESRGEDVSTCDPAVNHSESISHTVSVPLQTTLGTLEEIAC
uniref:Acid-sensing ion channel 2 n=1 Tax=Denticeps clupeoides TaxID=299321 RepID=A0AAY4CE39_9TELE